MSKMRDREYLIGTAYADASRLNARIKIHTYSTNPYPWMRWVFDKLQLPENARILELGCGTGLLWVGNAERIPPGWDITLTDLSSGMLDGTRTALAGLGRVLAYHIVDAGSIPFGPGSFHAVIANHMLYHVSDCQQALAEIHRVLKPGGRLHASTVGVNHMKELFDLIYELTGIRNDRAGAEAAVFGLQTGREKLESLFSEVTLHEYANSLEVPDAQVLLDYVLSLNEMDDSTSEQRESIRRALEGIVESRGAVHITHESGLFVARK